MICKIAIRHIRSELARRFPIVTALGLTVLVEVHDALKSANGR